MLLRDLDGLIDYVVNNFDPGIPTRYLSMFFQRHGPELSFFGDIEDMRPTVTVKASIGFCNVQYDGVTLFVNDEGVLCPTPAS